MASQGWVVTGQVSDVPVPTQAGQTIVGVQVYFTTADGNEGSVFIANAHYSVAKVRAAIKRQAALLDEVGQLAEGILSQQG
jgi:hypothetical protein